MLAVRVEKPPVPVAGKSMANAVEPAHAPCGEKQNGCQSQPRIEAPYPACGDAYAW